MLQLNVLRQGSIRMDNFSENPRVAPFKKTLHLNSQLKIILYRLKRYLFVTFNNLSINRNLLINKVQTKHKGTYSSIR